MPLRKDLDPVMHRIRAKLHANNLPNVKGKYIARTNNQKMLSVEDVCAALVTRGGFDGEYTRLVDYVQKYLDEVAYQLCDGYAINNGYYAIWPNIGGTFESPNESHDSRKQPVSFRFGMRSQLQRLTDSIKVEIDGLAETSAYIDSFIDNESENADGQYRPGHMFTLSGRKIKILGDEQNCGLYFVPVDDPERAVKVSRISKNYPACVSGIAVDTGFPHNRLEIRTQFSASSGSPLKTVRTITSPFIVQAV